MFPKHSFTFHFGDAKRGVQSLDMLLSNVGDGEA